MRQIANTLEEINLHSTVVLLIRVLMLLYNAEKIVFTFYCSSINTLVSWFTTSILSSFTFYCSSINTMYPEIPAVFVNTFTFYCSSINTISFSGRPIIATIFTFYCSSINTWYSLSLIPPIPEFTFYCSSINTLNMILRKLKIKHLHSTVVLLIHQLYLY